MNIKSIHFRVHPPFSAGSASFISSTIVEEEEDELEVCAVGASGDSRCCSSADEVSSMVSCTKVFSEAVQTSAATGTTIVEEDPPFSADTGRTYAGFEGETPSLAAIFIRSKEA